MAGSVSLAFDILARDRASKEFDNVTHSIGRASAAGSFFGTIAGSVVSKGLGVLKDAAAGAIGQIGSTVTAASNLGESISKSQRVFGTASASIEAFGETAATSLGLSKQAAIESAATFGNLFTSLQIAPAQSAQMSKTLVGLAGDLASFNNVDTETALDALKSGLLGEAEPLRQFGVTLSEARVQAEALADGLVKPAVSSAKLRDAQTTLALATERARVATSKNGATSAQAISASQQVERAAGAVAKAVQGQVAPLTASQKAQAALNIIMKDTKNSQGDFARTSGGLANQQRILAANFENVRAKIGQALLPKITELAQYVNSDVVPAVLGFIDGMKTGTGAGGKFADALGSLRDAAKTAFDVLKPIIGLVVDHPQAFATIAIGAVALGSAMKVMAGFTALRGLLFGVAEAETAVGAAGATASKGVAALLGPLGIAYGIVKGGEALNKQINGESPFAGVLGGKSFSFENVADGVRQQIIDQQRAAIPGYDEQSSLSQQRRRQLEDDLRGDDPKAAARARALLAAATTTASSAGTAASQAFKTAAIKITPSIADAIKAGKTAAVDAARSVVDRVKAEFDTAKSKLAETVQAALSFRKQIAEALTSGSALTDVFGSGTNLNANGAFGGGRGDFARIKTFLQARLDRIRAFTKDLRTLLARGLRSDLVAQIAQAGVDGGQRIAQGLLAGGAGGVGQINRLTTDIGKVSDVAGTSLADAQFRRQLAADRAHFHSVNARLDVANHYLSRLSGKPAGSAGTQRASAALLGA